MSRVAQEDPNPPQFSRASTSGDEEATSEMKSVDESHSSRIASSTVDSAFPGPWASLTTSPTTKHRAFFMQSLQPSPTTDPSVVPNTPISLHLDEPIDPSEIITPVLHTRPIQQSQQQLQQPHHSNEEVVNGRGEKASPAQHDLPPSNTNLAAIQSSPPSQEPVAEFHSSPSSTGSRSRSQSSANALNHQHLTPRAHQQQQTETPPMNLHFRSMSENALSHNSDHSHLEPALGLLDPITMSSNPATGSIRITRGPAGGGSGLNTLSGSVIQMSPLYSATATPIQDHSPLPPHPTAAATSSTKVKKSVDPKGGGNGGEIVNVASHTNLPSGSSKSNAALPWSSPFNESPTARGGGGGATATDADYDYPHLVQFHPTESWLGKKCGLLFPASCGGYNFVKVFVIMTACQVIVTCALVWLVGYLGLLSATNSLSHDIRSSVMSDVLSNVNDELSKPIRAANQIHYLTRQRFPDIDTRTSVTDDPGYLADLFHVGLQYPTVARISYVNANGVYVSIQRAKNGTEFSSVQYQAITINDPQAQQLHTYRPAPIPARNVIPNSAPLYTRPEIRGDDSAAFIRSYLGPPIFTLSNFTVFDLTFMPAILASVEQSTLRQQDPTVTDLSAGWSAPFTAVARGDSTDDYLALSNFIPSVDPLSGNFTMAGISLFRLGDLEDSFKDQHYGTHGVIHLIRAGGGIVASSDLNLRQRLEATQSAIPLNDLMDDDLISQMTELLREWKLIDLNTPNDTVVIPRNVSYTTEQFSSSLHANGYSWRINAQMLDKHLAALPYTIVLLTRDDDFDGGFQTILRNSSLVAAAICLAAMILAFAITRCLTRPLLQVVDYMSRAVRVISMERGPSQREALTVLCEEWSKESGMQMPKLNGATQDPHHAFLTDTDTYFADTPLYASFCWLCNNSGDTCCCYRVGRSLREVQAMHAAFGSMIYTLASYDELEAINQAKRQFIRYIFHEVRVPFNAIVLGIEQMQLELTPLGSMCASTIETLNILREQSSVVSRILNDVLSMQKIEDGALALEYDSFSLEKMIRAALYAFRTPCLEKRLKVRVNLRNLDAIVNEALPGLQLGKHQKRVSSASHSSQSGGGLNPIPSQPESGLIPHLRAPITSAVSATESAFISAIPSQPQLLSTVSKGPPGADTSSESVQLSANVLGDHYRLRQCLANFVSNAVKFTGIGGVIRVSLELTNFEPNPLATIASDHILKEMGIEPKKPNQSNSKSGSSRERKTQPHGASLKQIHTIDGSGCEMVEIGGLNQVDNHGELNQQGSKPSSIKRESEPLIPELLGTVRVRVAVKDNGSGIPLEHQAHIFEAYHQVQAGKIQAGNGTGLGLNISKSIIELHGGSIGYTSTPGSGAEFYFSLPMDVMLVKSVGRNNHDSNSFETQSLNSGVTPSDFKQQPYYTQDHSPLPTIPGSTDHVTRDLQKVDISSTSNVAAGRTPTDLTNIKRSSSTSTLLPTDPSSNLPPIMSNSQLSGMVGQSNQLEQPLPSDSLPPDPDQSRQVSASSVDVVILHRESSSSSQDNSVSGVLPVGVTPSSSSSTPAAAATMTGSTSEASSAILQYPLMEASGGGVAISSSTIPSALNEGSTSSVVINPSSSHPSSRGGSGSSGSSSGGGVLVRRNSKSNLGVAVSSISSLTNTTHSHAQNLIQSVIKASPTIASAVGNASIVTPGSSVTVNPDTLTSSPAAPPATSSSTVTKKPVGSPPSNSLQGCRVLVVEDSHPNRKLLISLLTHMGCKSAGAENGLECVNIFKDSFVPTQVTQSVTPIAVIQSPLGDNIGNTTPNTTTTNKATPSSSSAVAWPPTAATILPSAPTPAPVPFDIILMDGSMPIMNGIEATQILRSHGLKIPIIAVTGNALDEDVKAFMMAGADSVLTKPVNRNKLEQVLKTYFHQQK